MPATTGKRMRIRRLTGFEGFIRINLSCFEVSARIMGGWITGTSAI